MRALLICVACACSGKSQQTPPPVAKDASIIDAVSIDAAPPFEITERDESMTGKVVTLRPHGATCPSVEWRPIGRGTVRLERCKNFQPLADQLPALRDMISYLRTQHGTAFEDVRLVGWGDYYSYPEFAKRLAEHAQQVPYDREKGLHNYIKDAAASADLAPELAVIFQRKPTLVDVEKCSSGRPNGRGEVAAWLREQGLKGNAELPVGCAMTTFAFSR